MQRKPGRGLTRYNPSCSHKLDSDYRKLISYTRGWNYISGQHDAAKPKISYAQAMASTITIERCVQVRDCTPDKSRTFIEQGVKELPGLQSKLHGLMFSNMALNERGCYRPQSRRPFLVM